MTRPEDIPPEMVALLDERAGKAHSAEGQVLTTLAELLTMWDARAVPAPPADDEPPCAWRGPVFMAPDDHRCPNAGTVRVTRVDMDEGAWLCPGHADAAVGIFGWDHGRAGVSPQPEITRQQIQEAIHDAYVGSVDQPSFLTVASMWKLTDAVWALLADGATPRDDEQRRAELLAQVEDRRTDAEFMGRLAASIERNRPILDRLADGATPAGPLQQRIKTWHTTRFPAAEMTHVTLKAIEELGEVAEAVNSTAGANSATANGELDAPGEAADVVIALMVLVSRWWPGVDLLTEVERKVRVLEDPTSGHRAAARVGATPAGPDGASLITAERRRQVEAEGWTSEHDNEHRSGELIAAAVSYAQAADQDGAGECAADCWPFVGGFKPSDDPVRNLVRAGALLAAEIDRLTRVGATPAEDDQRPRDVGDELIDALGDARIVVWFCPTDHSHRVEWTTHDDKSMTPRCLDCDQVGPTRAGGASPEGADRE